MAIRTIITRDVNLPITLDDQTGQLYTGGVPCTNADPTTHINNAIVKLASTDIINLKATPFVVIPALPAGQMLQPILATFQYIPVSVDYTIGNATQIFIGSSVNPTNVNVLQPIAATILSGGNGPGNAVGVLPAANPLVASQSWFENQSLVLTHNGSAELSVGDGLVVVKVYYAVVAL